MNKSNINQDNTKSSCDICGKTFSEVINHHDKKICKECYMEIINE